MYSNAAIVSREKPTNIQAVTVSVLIARQIIILFLKQAYSQKSWSIAIFVRRQMLPALPADTLKELPATTLPWSVSHGGRCHFFFSAIKVQKNPWNSSGVKYSLATLKIRRSTFSCIAIIKV
jgi:hypothetical protein